ncbi:helix-turn-helix transcriptional regulator [Paraburkholderia rhizosphaerae]|nr:AraC family transcriptional regulator [Paraburkholderia rhizosphaerae]
MFDLGGERGPISCRIGNRSLVHVSLPGNIAICPADIEFHGETRNSSRYLLLSIPKHSLAFFAAERAGSPCTLNAVLSGYDAQLLAAAGQLADEAAAGFSSGPSYWNELTDVLYGRLFQNYLFAAERSVDRTALEPRVMARINAYVTAHLCEPIDVDTIAAVAGKGRFHFPRIFRRSVGMSPYQYLVQLRLRHAIKMIRESEMSLVEIAAATGFVDQSHLCRWVKRVYGATPTQFAKLLAQPRAN